MLRQPPPAEATPARAHYTGQALLFYHAHTQPPANPENKFWLDYVNLQGYFFAQHTACGSHAKGILLSEMRRLEDTLTDDWDDITLQLDVQQALMQLTDTERQLVYARLEGRMKYVAQELGIRNPQRVWRAIQQRLKEALSGYP